EVAVHHQEVAGQRLALEQVRHLRLDAFVATGDRGDGGGGGDRDQQRVAQAVRLDSLAQHIPAGDVVGRCVRPVVELQLAVRGAAFGEARMRTGLCGQFVRLRQRVEVDL